VTLLWSNIVVLFGCMVVKFSRSRYDRVCSNNMKGPIEVKEILSHPIGLADQRFVWVPSYATDVQKTWAKFGWTPPSKNKEQKQ